MTLDENGHDWINHDKLLNAQTSWLIFFVDIITTIKFNNGDRIEIDMFILCSIL